MSRKCSECSVEILGPGNPRKCESCKEKAAEAKTWKTCHYRSCGQPFKDGSVKNCTQFCCDEHRHREKMFRLGKAQDESYFRAEKPKLQALCNICKERYERFDDGNRCLKCRSGARNKTCRGCGGGYLDETLKNSQRYCDVCSSR